MGQYLWANLSRYIAPTLKEGNVFSFFFFFHLEMIWVDVQLENQPQLSSKLLPL